MLDQINQNLVNLLGPAGPLLALGGLGIVLIVLALPTMLKRQKDPLERLKQQRVGAKVDDPQRLRRGKASRGADKLERFAG